MATTTWTGATNPLKWSNAADWSNGIPQAGDTAVIPAGTPTPLLDTTTGSTTVASVDVASGASLDIKDPGFTVTVTGDFTVDGGFGIDSTAFDPGGSTLAIGGTLTVTNAGSGFGIGNYLQGSDNTNPQPHGTPSTTTVTANSITNTGAITIQSYDALGSQAILNVASVAGFGGQVGVLTGNVNIGSDGLHAGSDGLLEFASGQITTIASGAGLFLYGAHSYLADAGSITSNSALTGLSTINGGVTLQAGASVATGALTVTSNGTLAEDAEFLGIAGSSFTVGGLLTVDGSLTIGRSAMTGDGLMTASSIAGTGTISLNGDTGSHGTGRLVVHSAAGFGPAGHVTGNVTVQGQSLLQFDSGQINTIDYPANVVVDGPSAFIADAGSTTSNSALTGLTNVNGFFTLLDGATLTTGAGVTIGDVNVAHFTGLNVDNSGSGGGSLNVGGALTFNNAAGMTIGNDGITASTNVTTSALDFAGTSQISLAIHGNTTVGSPNQGKLTVNAAAGFGTAGVLANGDVILQGNALLQFASGQINTIAFGANLFLNSANSFVADSGSTASNSALADLATVAGGLTLRGGASLSTSAGVTIGDGTHGAAISLDSGASLTVNGTVTINNAQDVLSVGSASDTVATTASATAIDFVGTGNSGLRMFGGTSVQTKLTLASAAGFGTAGTLAGATVELHGNTLLQFASGQITSTVFGSSLVLDGANAFIADAGSTSSNSALADLATLGGSLALHNGAPLTTNGGLTLGNGINGTTIQVDSSAGLAVNGTFTVNPSCNVAISGAFDSASSAITATGLSNSGVIAISGNTANGGANHGNLTISGAASNAGAINVSVGSLQITGALTGIGTIDLASGANVELGSTVGGETIHFGSGHSTLVLDTPGGFGGSITGFAIGDVLDLAHEIVTSLSYDGSTLTVNLQGGGTQTFAITGNVTSFAVHSDGAGGSDIVHSGTDDFNGDGMSDVLFSQDGAVYASNYEWQMNDRALFGQGAVDLYDKAFSTQVVGDYNGDGKSDVLFQDPTTGGVWEWQLDGTTIANQGAVDVADPTFHLLGSADFTGEGMDDLIFRNDAGYVYQWQMNGFTDTPLPVGQLDPNWHIVGTGDFTGDGKDDLLLHYANDGNPADPANGAFDIWQMNGNVVTNSLGVERPDPTWQILGAGDFNGDGISDIAIRNVSAGADNGAVWVYLMAGTTTSHGDGSTTADILAQGAAGIADAATWHPAEVGDLNGDGRGDVLFRNDAGYFYSWDMGTDANGKPMIASEGPLQGDSAWADPSFHVVTQHWDVV